MQDRAVCLCVRPCVRVSQPFLIIGIFWPKAPNLLRARRVLESGGPKGNVDSRIYKVKTARCTIICRMSCADLHSSKSTYITFAADYFVITFVNTFSFREGWL